MDLELLGNALVKSTPLLANAIVSPIGSMVSSMLATFLGVEQQQLTKAITTDPDAVIKLKQFELKHAEELAKISAANYVTEVDDRKDARKNSLEYKYFLRHFAYLVTAGFFTVLFLLFVPKINLQLNAEEKQLLALLTGVLVSKWQTIIDFFYGSSNRH